MVVVDESHDVHGGPVEDFVDVVPGNDDGDEVLLYIASFPRKLRPLRPPSILQTSTPFFIPIFDSYLRRWSTFSTVAVGPCPASPTFLLFFTGVLIGDGAPWRHRFLLSTTTNDTIVDRSLY